MIRILAKYFLFSTLLGSFWIASAQQTTISRIEEMPNLPSPYLMRNWKQVAQWYDSLVFNLNATGLYLPVVSINSSTINYPQHSSFKLHTYVGTKSPQSAEAINLLPAVVGASLSGIDKKNQFGNNWVLMCEEFFNKRPEENVYLNHPVTSSGDDWWYSTMPNVFFYQLYDLYPNTGDFRKQFTIVADRWLQAVSVMGGSATPWHQPMMDYRGWYLSTMTPNVSGVHQPEAAGAIAWLLYNAYSKTGEKKYRIGAEWSLEFLNDRVGSPSYELQLPYGVLTAARMNAELGTTYDIQKMLNWCFDVGPFSLRSWGAIVGNWGGFDVSGLIGEVNGSNDYAFVMNTFEQVGALVPLVRYDDRFARAIGKWVLNAANAARLFYPKYLPPQNQDGVEWSFQYDSSSYIAYEAIRQQKFNASPYATGDAVQGGWAQTNLSLYSSSHVGIFGGIIDTTNVSGILQLDLLKTDYFHQFAAANQSAYPSYLYYNPYGSSQNVTNSVGNSSVDLYDAVNNKFIQTNVSGSVTSSIAANSAIVIVFVPSNSSITYDGEKTLANNIVIDFRNGQSVANHPPRIKAAVASSSIILLGKQTTLFCTASDRDQDTLTITWKDSTGTSLGVGSEYVWTSPQQKGNYKIFCTVDDHRGNIVYDTVRISVVESLPTTPVISSITATPGKIDLNGTTTITCVATDSSQSELAYMWSVSSGTFTGSGKTITWKAPAVKGNYNISCTVINSGGASATDSIAVMVRDFSIQQTGELIAYYPFTGNANDASGNANNGTVNGASLVADRNGIPNSAYIFNGIDDHILVSNTLKLNFQNSISVSFWMRVDEFFYREQYPISHGNWERRWKVSITNKRIRWTVKTTTGINDLDSKMILTAGIYYHVVLIYDGSDMEIFINGALDSFTSFSDSLLQTNLDLTIGQVIPGNQNYNFRGILDEIRVHDYGLSVKGIQSLYDYNTSVPQRLHGTEPVSFLTLKNYPNPFNGQTWIEFNLPQSGDIIIKVFDILGREIATVINGYLTQGSYRIQWMAENLQSGVYFLRLETVSKSEVKKIILIK